jgi:hypothetical protein
MAAAVGGVPSGDQAVVYLVEDGGRQGQVLAARTGVGERFGFVAAGHAELVLAELDALQRLVARGDHRPA